MSLVTRSEYWDDARARTAFKNFILEIHNLDFTAWESAGYWDHAYTPFSLFQGNEVVASMCLYLLDAVIDGRTTRVAQISGVGTLPTWRRQGLNRRLTDLGLDWARGKHDGVFLFSDTGAIPFYRRCGFTPIEERLEFMEIEPVSRRPGAVHLDPSHQETLDRIYGYARARAPISNRFSVLNAKLVMFHVLYLLSDHVYEIPELDCLVFCKREGDRLSIIDVLAEEVPSFAEFYPYLADGNDRIVEFHFHTDKLGLGAVRTKPLRGNNPFVKDPFPLDKPVFPYTSRA